MKSKDEHEKECVDNHDVFADLIIQELRYSIKYFACLTFLKHVIDYDKLTNVDIPVNYDI